MTTQLVLVLVLTGLVVAVLVGLRSRPFIRSRRISSTGLEEGLYLFTSTACGTCGGARTELERRKVPFTEISWQADPGLFEELGMDAVPSVVLVGPDGGGRWWRGVVPRHLPGIQPGSG
jgi:hypothetical protein